ncbi:hypothetical protein EKK58_08550 [Candidatus Dependentiae bacterium]|nr:MAG: hypothetical protein EKK58_08550 [Candidatus Dependentiae bacterium]
MASFQTKGSRFALVPEVTEGTPVSPSSGGQYIALQDGYDLEPAFDTLENAELTGSIGKAKPVLGLENPTVSLSHYIRHSGVEGQEPNFGKMIEGILGGKSVNGTQYNTTTGSTAGSATAAATIAHAVGTGTNFERGEGLLIKDGTNGYKIRNVLSVATDTSTLNFNLSAAPGSGVGLGKAVLYKPGTSYPTFTAWDYRGNGGAVQMVAGSRVTEMSIEASAGEYINGSFTLEGLSYYFNPIELTSSNNKLDFDDGSEKNVTIAAGFYKDPHDLASAVQTAMDAASSDTITCVYNDSTGKFTITSDGSSLDLLWNTGTNTAQTIGTKLGFLVAADDTGSLSYTSDNALVLSSPQQPSLDSADPLVAKNNEVFIGGFADSSCFCASTLALNIASEKTDVLCVCAESGKQESVITSREVTIELTAVLEQYEADKFHRFHTNQTTAFAYNFGEKSGGNWIPGKCGNIYMPSCTISSFKVSDQDGLVALEMTLTGFVDSSGNGEIYLNFL